MFYIAMIILWIALAFFMEWLDKPRLEANKKEIENASDYELICYDSSIFGDWEMQDMIHDEIMKRNKEKRKVKIHDLVSKIFTNKEKDVLEMDARQQQNCLGCK